MKKINEVVQSNKLVESRYSLTVGEQRLILAMVSKIHSDDLDFFKYEISLKELSDLMNIDLSNAYHEMDKITEKIMGRVLHIPQPDGTLLKAHWVSTALHKKNSVVLSFAPDLKPYLLHLKSEFTKCSLTIVNKFQSIYSIRIYQLLKQYKNIGYREFKIVDLKAILGIKSDQYKTYKDFKKRILYQAKKEFENKDNRGNFQCDITFDLETIREGRRIERLKFTIIPQEYNRKNCNNEVLQSKPETTNKSSYDEVETAELDRKIFNEFLEHAKVHDKFIYNFYLKHGRAFMVQGAYIKFLDEREKEQKARQG
jgi:plasmid replication initiation protein